MPSTLRFLVTNQSQLALNRYNKSRILCSGAMLLRNDVHIVRNIIGPGEKMGLAT
jgi:hypothetical protein